MIFFGFFDFMALAFECGAPKDKALNLISSR